MTPPTPAAVRARLEKEGLKPSPEALLYFCEHVFPAGKPILACQEQLGIAQ